MPSSVLHAGRRAERRPGEAADDALRLTARGAGRRPVLALGSAALVLTCVAVFVALYAHAGSKVPVLLVTRAVAQGAPIPASDLRVVDVPATPGLAVVPASRAHEVIGRTATSAIGAGSLLSRADLGSSGGVPAGDVVVGVAAQAGQLPAGGVEVGDRVDVDVTGGSGSVDAAAATAPTGGTGSTGSVTLSGGVIAEDVPVVAVTAGGAVGTATSSSVVSVAVPAAAGPFVANASVAGQAALTLVGPAR